MINFSQIGDVRTPGTYIEFDNSNAIGGLPAAPHRLLLIGQRLSSGRVGAGIPTRITSADAGDEAFGRGSYLAESCRAVRAVTRSVDVWAVALDDVGGGAVAQGYFEVTGTATASGTLAVYVGGHRLAVAVVSGQTGDAVLAALEGLATADTRLPVLATADLDTNRLNLIARHKGTLGNQIDLRLSYNQGEQVPAGLTVTVGAMASGASDPSLQIAIDAIVGTHYHTIVTPFVDSPNLTLLETELARRWDAMVALEAHAFGAVVGTASASSTLTSSRNSPYLTIVAPGQSPTPSWLVAATLAAVDAQEPDPARPRQTLALAGVLPPAESQRFSREARDTLLHEGAATTTVDYNGTVRIERVVTTYRLNGQGNADMSYLDVETLRTLAYVRFAVRTRITNRFPRFKLANDGAVITPGQPVVTPRIIKAELVALFRELAEAALVEEVDALAAEMRVERSTTDTSRVNAWIPPDLVNQFRVLGMMVAFKL